MTNDAAIAARRAGLHWVHDGRPGISRRRRRDGSFGYFDASGRSITDPSVRARLDALAIPPAWVGVWICPLANGHLQATGRDACGRKQYRYHADWEAGRGQTKFDGMVAFGAVLPRIRRRVQQALGGPPEPSRERVMATLVRLLDTTWLRIGNSAYARENGSYGLSTLRNRHVAVQGDRIDLSFVGKSGVRHRASLNDRRVARLVRRCRDLPGQELFQYLDATGAAHAVGSADVNEWLAAAGGRRVTAKDFRTWHGSVFALETLMQVCRDGSTPGVTQMVAAVAERLGNTPAVCRKAYIHPRLFDLCEALAGVADDQAAGGLRRLPWVPAATSRPGLRAAERSLLGLLRWKGRLP